MSPSALPCRCGGLPLNQPMYNALHYEATFGVPRSLGMQKHGSNQVEASFFELQQAGLEQLLRWLKA